MASTLGPRSGPQSCGSSSFDAALQTTLHLGYSFVKLVEVDGRSFAPTGAAGIECEELLLLQTVDGLHVSSCEHTRLVQLCLNIIAWVVTDEEASQGDHDDGEDDNRAECEGKPMQPFYCFVEHLRSARMVWTCINHAAQAQSFGCTALQVAIDIFATGSELIFAVGIARQQIAAIECADLVSASGRRTSVSDPIFEPGIGLR